MAYEAQINELKNILPSAQNILIALPVGSDIDKLASALALYLSLTQAGKQVTVVCEDPMRVAESHLFAIDKVQNNLQTGNGNYTLTLEGVEIAADGTVPALTNLDWYPEGNNKLNLVFHTVPGKTFNPTNVVPKAQSAAFNLILVLGASNLNALGNIYNQNSQAFAGSMVNIDNQANANFGTINIVEPNAASLSEIIVSIITGLGLPFTADEASNLLAGIFESTNNLTGPKTNPETYMAVAQALRVGGRKPNVISPQAAPQPQVAAPQPTPGLDLSAFLPKEAPIPFME